MKQKGFANTLIIAVIVILILGAAAGYFLFNKEPELVTDNSKPDIGGDTLKLKGVEKPLPPLPAIGEWVTYRNESCGFEIKYPPTYVEWKATGSCDNLDDPERDPEVLSMVNLPNCRFPFKDTPGCQPHSILVASNKARIEGAGVSREMIRLNDLDWEKITVIGEPESTVGSIYLQAEQDPGVWYRYIFSFNLKDRKPAEETLSKIISTFKIFKELKSAWKSFKGEGFAFEYPENWRVGTTQEGIATITTFTDGGPKLSVRAAPNQGGITLEEWWQEISRDSRWKKAGERTIAGIQAYRLVLPETDAGSRYILITGEPRKLGGRVYDIQMTGMDTQTANRVLFTFTF